MSLSPNQNISCHDVTNVNVNSLFKLGNHYNVFINLMQNNLERNW